MQCLRKAFLLLDKTGNYNPTVTFVVVQKRHNTRLYLANPGDADNKSGNVPAGTVVDTDICHPSEYDFYLMGQARRGLGRGRLQPVHDTLDSPRAAPAGRPAGHVDENSFGANALQSLCYRLSYLYCRATRSVSIVPPVYYAHLAAFRGRILARDMYHSDTMSTFSRGTGGSGGTAGSGAFIQPKPIKVAEALKDRLFFV